MSLEERLKERKRRIVGHHAKNHDDAELWDLLFWQAQSPEDRLSALVHIHKDIQSVHHARKSGS